MIWAQDYTTNRNVIDAGGPASFNTTSVKTSKWGRLQVVSQTAVSLEIYVFKNVRVQNRLETSTKRAKKNPHPPYIRTLCAVLRINIWFHLFFGIVPQTWADVGGRSASGRISPAAPSRPGRWQPAPRWSGPDSPYSWPGRSRPAGKSRPPGPPWGSVHRVTLGYTHWETLFKSITELR